MARNYAKAGDDVSNRCVSVEGLAGAIEHCLSINLCNGGNFFLDSRCVWDKHTAYLNGIETDTRTGLREENNALYFYILG